MIMAHAWLWPGAGAHHYSICPGNNNNTVLQLQPAERSWRDKYYFSILFMHGHIAHGWAIMDGYHLERRLATSHASFSAWPKSHLWRSLPNHTPCSKALVPALEQRSTDCRASPEQPWPPKVGSRVTLTRDTTGRVILYSDLPWWTLHLSHASTALINTQHQRIHDALSDWPWGKTCTQYNCVHPARMGCSCWGGAPTGKGMYYNVLICKSWHWHGH